MDKEIWLRVIRGELDLLDKLATGMIEDDQLTKEEVELAISRSRMVAREFEMLMHLVPEHSSSDVKADGEKAPETPEPEVNPIPVILMEKITEDIPVYLPEQKEILTPFETTLPDLLLISENEFSQDSSEELEGEKSHKELVVDVQSEPEILPLSPSPSPSSPHPLVPSSPRPEPEEHGAIDHEVKKEEHPLFKLTPIKSLKEGMTLNDRYLFQKELFGNDKSRLDETVADMDRLANIQEAIAYLKAHFKWMKGEASEKFILLVKRRFSEPKG